MPSSEKPFLEIIDQLADRFELEFHGDSKPTIEAYLSEQTSELRPYLLRELLRLEIDLRRGVGEQPVINEYLQRFPSDRAIVELVFVSSAETTIAIEQYIDQAQSPAGEEPLPKKIGRYEVERLFGRGGFGRVYLAWDPDLQRNVAVKRARRDRFETPEQVANFIREGSKTAELKHDRLVTIYDVGKEDGLPYIVQQYIAGENLGEWAIKHQPSFSKIVQILMGLTEALGIVHQHLLTHCDLKLANVLACNCRCSRT